MMSYSMGRCPMYNALVIGAGFMGSKKDIGPSLGIYTHGKAYSRHPQFNLVGFLDSNLSVAKNAAAVWGGKAYNDLDEAFSNRIDVVSVVVPDNIHYPILKELARRDMSLVLCEKPFVETIEHAQDIVDLYKKEGIYGAVNYTRRYLPQIQQLKREIASGAFGEYLFSKGYFGNGLVHDGSHMVDLLLYLLDTTRNFDYEEIPSSLYRIFELDLFFQTVRIRLTDFTWQIEYQTRGVSPFYGWQIHMNHEKTIKTDIGIAMFLAVANVANFLDGTEPLLCTFEDAKKTLEVSLCLEQQKSKQ